MTRLASGAQLVGPLKVYLAGPITGLSYAGATGWRTEFAAQLADLGVQGYSPLRLQSYLEQFELIDNGGPDSTYHGMHPLTNVAGIVQRDRNDVLTSDLVFVNLLGADKASIGSVMELGWADAYRKPIVVALDKGGVHDHAMIHGVAGFITYDLDMALECIEGVLLP